MRRRGEPAFDGLVLSTATLLGAADRLIRSQALATASALTADDVRAINDIVISIRVARKYLTRYNALRAKDAT